MAYTYRLVRSKRFWLTGLFSWLGLAPSAWADIAVVPSSQFLDSPVLLLPLLLLIILLEALILWQFWGKKAAYSLLEVFKQITKINLISSLAGIPFLVFSDFIFPLNPYLALIGVHFPLTLLLEGLLLQPYYSPHKTSGRSTRWTPLKASTAINSASYGLLLLVYSFLVPHFPSTPRAYSTKANMHSLQTMIETYGLDWGGEYPQDLLSLKKEATSAKHPYWLELVTPNNQPALKMPGEQVRPFCIEYQAIQDPKSKRLLFYKIYGYDVQGHLIMQNGSVFTLNNLEAETLSNS